MLDLRTFIGAFFLLVGVILTIAGVVSPVDTAGYNLNLIVGICFLVFGAGASLMGRAANKRA